MKPPPTSIDLPIQYSAFKGLIIKVRIYWPLMDINFALKVQN